MNAVETDAKKAVSWISANKILALIIAAALAALVFSNYWLYTRMQAERATAAEQQAQKNASQKEQVAQAAQQQAAQVVQQATSAIGDAQKAIIQKDQTIAVLKQSMDALTAQTTELIQQIKAMNASQVAADTRKILAVAPTEIQDTPTGLAFTLPAAKTNLTSLVEGQDSKQQLTLEKQTNLQLGQKFQSAQTIAEQMGRELTAQKKSASATDDALRAEINAREKEIVTVNAQARHAKLNYFIAGAVSAAVAIGLHQAKVY